MTLAIPMMIQNGITNAVGLVDNLMVGSLGTESMTSVSIVGQLVFVFFLAIFGGLSGPGIYGAQYFGQGNKKGYQNVFRLKIWITAVITLCGLAAFIFAGDKMIGLYLHGSDGGINSAQTLDLGLDYLHIMLIGLVPFAFTQIYAGSLREMGESIKPMVGGIASVVIDIVFNYLLIYGKFGFPRLGVEGAAIATDASQLVSCVMAIIYMVRVNADYKLFIRQIKVHRDMAIRIIKIGLPTGIQNMVISFSNVLVQASVNSFGSDAVAGFGAYLKVDGFNILPVLSISMAVTTFVGQNYGANKPERVKKGMWTALGMGVVYTVITGILLLVFADPILRLFTNDDAVAACGETAMKYFCPFYFLLAIMNVLAGAVRGTGKSIPPMLILLFAMCIFRIFWIWLVVPLFPTIDGVYLLYPVSWVIGVVLMALYTWKGKWMPKIE